jgi:hypothetical protein
MSSDPLVVSAKADEPAQTLGHSSRCVLFVALPSDSASSSTMLSSSTHRTSSPE